MKTRALVTGGSRGIGAAIAEALAEAGHDIILNYRANHDAASAVKAKCEAKGVRVELAPFDVADAGAAGEAMAKLLADERPIGILVNNAGVARDVPFPTLTRDDWEGVLKTSLGGFYNVTQPLVMPMVQKRWGRIITLSSISGLVGNRGQVNYSAAKAGLIGATKALAKEVAKRNVTVNAVAPGLIETDMIKEASIDQILPLIPMRRLGKAREVADLVAFLASDKAAYITGQVISIDGGMV
jgi:3-oxoacyl-[acyl-carrier protein] reductase